MPINERPVSGRRRWVVRGTVLLAAALLGPLSAISTASASPNLPADPGQCSGSTRAGAYCIWVNANFYGSMGANYGSRNWDGTPVAFLVYNDSSSHNNGTSGMGVYPNTTYGSYCAARGAWWGQHRPNDSGYGNTWTRNC
jgi:hypothetical protein